MKLYLDTNACLLSLSQGGSNTSVNLPAKAGTTLELEIFPSSDLSGDATGVLTTKPKGNYGASPVARALSWTAPTTSGAGYLFALDLNTSELLDLFTGTVDTVQLMADITWVSDGKTSKSQTFTISVGRPVATTDDGSPTEIPDLKASQAEAEAGTDNTKWMTPERTAQAIATLALPDALQFANLAAFPTTGSISVIYLAQDTNLLYRWSGSAYVQVGGSGGGGSSSFTLYNDSNLDSGWFTAVAGGKYAVDTTTAAAFCQLPASPAVGDTIEFADAKGTWNDHAFTINRNGKKIEGIEINYADTAQGTQFFIVYIDDTTGWKIFESGTKPHILVAPTAPTGTAQVGSVLTADNGTWTGSPTSYSYQWKNSPDGTTWTNISGATSSTYTLQSGDATLYVACEITAANSNGNSLPSLSTATAAIAALTPALGLVAQYKFDDSGDLGLDSTANTNELTNNGPAGTSAGPAGGSDLAFLGDGTSYLSRGSQLIPSGDWSIRFQLQNNGGGVICTSCTTGFNGVLLHSFSGAMNVQIGNDGGDALLNTTVPLPASSAWGEYLFTYNATTGAINCYKEGTNVLSDTIVGTIGTVSNNFWVGARWDGYAGTDAIDSLCIWNRELSSAESTAILGVDI